MQVDLVQLQAVHTELEKLHERCMEGLPRTEELRQAIKQFDSHMQALLPRGSDLFHLFNRRRSETTDWWQKTRSKYVDSADCRNIGRRIAVVRELLARISPEFLQKTTQAPEEYYFPPGDIFRARQRLFQIMSRVSYDVLIVDPYLDPVVLDFVESLASQVMVRMLTGQSKALFVKQFHSLQVARPNVEARISSASHDRWIVLDGTEVWHLGASISSLGKTASRMRKIDDSAQAQRILYNTANWWSAGGILE